MTCTAGSAFGLGVGGNQPHLAHQINEALTSRILSAQLNAASETDIASAVCSHWADFDLYTEAHRIDVDSRAQYREWLDGIIQRKRMAPIPSAIRSDVIGILVANGLRFEARAKMFKEIHPLALQVILSTGVLNGILVVRSVEQCALALRSLILNDLDFNLEMKPDNYKLIDTVTRSTIRVISRNELLRNAFGAQYRREKEE